jgi:hypothetical protein
VSDSDSVQGRILLFDKSNVVRGQAVAWLHQVNTLTGSADVDLEVEASGSSYGFVTTSTFASQSGGETQVTIERAASMLSGSVDFALSEKI